MSQLAIVQFANGTFAVRKGNHYRNFEYMESKANGVWVKPSNKGAESTYQVATLSAAQDILAREVANETFDYGVIV